MCPLGTLTTARPYVGARRVWHDLRSQVSSLASSTFCHDVHSRAYGRPGRVSAYYPSTLAGLSRLTLASATVGHLLHVPDLYIVAVRQGLIQHHRQHCMEWRAAILSILDGPLNFRHFHVMAPGAPATGDWMDVWRDFVSAERQTKGFGSNGDWKCRALPGRYVSSPSSLAIQKSTRLPSPAIRAVKLFLSARVDDTCSIRYGDHRKLACHEA
ncbi:hypothetical protein BKA70DRAFT_57264 [Coprinopsis sp. MPI-PUGE-AT-0042]|nr:hypothetical protein BKA70DRAFT_57264 [Coprinopsis sp. MPI-PUGE-AT-0042]